MLESLKFLLNFEVFCVKTSRVCHFFCSVLINVIALRCQICKPLVVYRFYCMALYHSLTRRYVIRQGIASLLVELFCLLL